MKKTQAINCIRIYFPIIFQLYTVESKIKSFFFSHFASQSMYGSLIQFSRLHRSEQDASMVSPRFCLRLAITLSSYLNRVEKE